MKKQFLFIIVIFLCLCLPACKKTIDQQTIKTLSPINKQESFSVSTESYKPEKNTDLLIKKISKKTTSVVEETQFIVPPIIITKKEPLINERTIIINNTIDDTMLSYKHWTGTYKPNKFHIFIKGQEVSDKKQISVTTNNKLFSITYAYEFMSGYRADKRKIIFTLDDKIDTINLAFSWHDKWHLLCDHAQPIKVVQL